jgi:hypothetical protein
LAHTKPGDWAGDRNAPKRSKIGKRAFFIKTGERLVPYKNTIPYCFPRYHRNRF